ncbi:MULTISPECIES: hypothetical protein [unclassified Lentimonas]|uniref:hypothetical protein n=1 Tax=unclassified Lentimonas TaxID=2630993 RepID=UPI00132AEC26|nr:MULTISPECIES: hypothetical protein [unclassified Lentimonas]CAA6678429.1 Unannotated [Lentimonas sp. CC4]CAA6685521.1 Unannotated [Lentimonas sp. CC6]CAA7076969.1 Unannotated [Lentimonas sp. CC4]CAA7170520.1 Unannotated [Lentimonas sp. CC21]CAA7179783.1 Unannotated [Lentimonas sp. CC8]
MAKSSKGRLIGTLMALAALVTAGILGMTFYHSTASIHELLTENHELNKAVRNLTQEDNIGYATLQSQSKNELGELQSVVRFVQTAAGDPKTVVSEQLFTITGDIVHFDALIVKFTNEYVKDGSERALYLWRRIYGETTTPADGEAIEMAGSAPERYYSITESLKLNNRDIFWEAIWDLANDTTRLSDYGVQAVFGNAVYTRVEPGKVYLFKISATGQIYPETVNTY